MIRIGNEYQWLGFNGDETVVLYPGDGNKVIELPAKELIERLMASLRQEDMFSEDL